MFDLFFKQLTDEQKASIKVVTGDGAKWIDSCVHEWCPQAERVLDGFHIVSWMTGALDDVRKRLWNDARRGGDQEGVKRMPYAQAGYAAPGQPYPPQGAYYGYPYPAPVNQRWNTLCIVGFILSFVFAPAGLVLSVIALIQINKSGEKSKGMSIAGIIIGAVNTILLVMIVALFMWAFEASVDMVHNGDIEFGNGGSSPTDCAVTINGECLSYGDLRKYGIDPDDLDDLSRLGLDLNSGSGRTTALSTVQ